MGNLRIEYIHGTKVVFNDGIQSEEKVNGWSEYKSPLRSLDITIKLDLKSNGDMSILLGDNGKPCKIKINNYIMEQLKNGI